MSYKDLLVHIDSSEHCNARLALAVALARRFDAHLSGLYVMPSLEISPYIADQFPTTALEAAQTLIAQQREDAKAMFAATTGPLGDKAEWLEKRGDRFDRIEALRRAAYCADLAILGQADPEDGAEDGGSYLREQVVMGSGRPVLLVPYAGNFATLGERVLVAWNASAQAARAINDALPLLKTAKRVVILTINPEDGNRGDSGAPGADIARHLTRHGIEAEPTHIIDHDVDVADLLLSRVTDEAADMIVMGVYGHSRLRELVLGGVSRALFAHMTVPVLMAH